MLFIIFISSMIFVYFAANTFVSAIKNNIELHNKFADTDVYTVFTEKGNPLHYGEISNIIDNYGKLRSLLLIDYKENEPWPVGFTSTNYGGWFIKSEGRYFSEEEEKEGLNVVMPAYNLLPIDSIITGDTWKNLEDIEYHISDIDYTIVGTVSSALMLRDVKDYYEHNNVQDKNSFGSAGVILPMKNTSVKLELIPCQNYINNEFEIDAIKIGFDQMIKISLIDLENDFKEVRSDLKIIPPKKYEETNRENVILELIIYSLLLFFCIINLIAFFSYWLHLNKKEFAVMSIYGASQGNIVLQIILGLVLLNFISFTAAQILQLIAKPFYYIFGLKTHLSFKEMMGMLGVITFMTIVPLLKQMLYMSNSNNAIKNESA